MRDYSIASGADRRFLLMRSGFNQYAAVLMQEAHQIDIVEVGPALPQGTEAGPTPWSAFSPPAWS